MSAQGGWTSRFEDCSRICLACRERCGDRQRDETTCYYRRSITMLRQRRLFVESLEHRLVPSTYYLHQGDILQKFIHAAQPGDVLLLDAGATFLGTVTLEAKPSPSNLPITIATNLFPLSS